MRDSNFGDYKGQEEKKCGSNKNENGEMDVWLPKKGQDAKWLHLGRYWYDIYWEKYYTIA